MQVVVQDLEVFLGGKSILSGVDLCLKSGESAAIMGPSGAGKSTLLAAITGQVPIAAGTVASTAHGSDIQWVVQSAPVLAHRTAIDNVALGPLSRGTGRLRARARGRAAMHALGIESLRNTRVRKLSGGEKQRVAIARAIAARPELLLVDEPTASLDHTNRILVMDALRKVVSAGATMILTTHDLAVAEICDRVLDLDGGRLRER